MPTLAIDSPLTALRGVGPVRAASLAEAGCRTVGDLLHHLPARYEDRRRISQLGEIEGPGAHTFLGEIRKPRLVRVRRRGLTLVRALLVDATGSLPVAWFNQPYLLQRLEEEGRYLVHGSVRRQNDDWQLVNPTVERPEQALLGGAVVPVYRALGGLGPAMVRRLVADLLERMEVRSEIRDPIPLALRRRHDLPDLGAALADLHQPGDGADVEALNSRQSPAHRRLIYGEMLALQLDLARRRSRQLRCVKPRRYRSYAELRPVLESVPPFRLTAAQRRVLGEILDDLAGVHPMRRLLQGDVGCGKTIVAALAMAAAAESGHQCALMAPTEILAEQHHRTLERLIGDRYRIGLLTGSSPDGSELRRRLAGGDCQLAVGTHALIQGGVEFRDLGLAIIDEQHRFGVGQRRALSGKGTQLDLLVMTATPIPRSLALTVYGDLALSVIDELPPGRSPVRTEVRPEAARDVVYEWLAAKLGEGEQAFVLLPLIEESEHLAAASIEQRGEEIRSRFAAFEPTVVHGRTPIDQRRLGLERFADGRSRLLVATTVIEVGVDVPAATLLVIENAERFGLAQLHQLRGRIGRGSGQRAVCVALHGTLTEIRAERLRMFASSTDGFQIAEADLALRGPGELAGTRQAGVPGFRVADLARDAVWIERARRDAAELSAAIAVPAPAGGGE